ncbi:hypothetical protein [Candidatus Electronema sp. PJ]|uniref:hypothetical protein n=1 Tax=Candidatus Electronema sp. PJ TaxID=3401572 RepID=UPI003AA9DA5A
MSDFTINLKRRCVSTASGAMLLASGLTVAVPISMALAFDQPPNTIQFTLEGCRNGGNTPITPTGTLPNADDNFVCQDPTPLGGNDTPYVTGNLGKGWNELDLVPHRLIVENSDDNSTTYNVLIAADHKTAGKTGYDVMTEPEILKSPDTLNTFSDSSCTVSASPQSIGGRVTGGADEVIYRILTITQGKKSTCVIDWANRLAVGAAQYPGSSLQSYMFEKDDFSTGKRTVSIPVKEIQPQELKKDMSASRETDYIWNATKTATPAVVNLGNTCDPNNVNSAPVTVRVEWEILPGIDGKVTVVTNIYAKNPAARAITVNVSDTMFGNLGSGQQALDTISSGNISVPANTEIKVLTHSFDAAKNVSDLSDTATASYVDTATGIPVTGQTQATASVSSIQPGTQTNTTAVVTDVESISGNGLQYSTDSTVSGSADGSFTLAGVPYTLGTKLDKDSAALLWTSATQNGNLSCTDPNGCPIGYVEFNKTVYVDPTPVITSGTLSDVATLTASNGFTISSGPATVNISASAFVDLTLVATIPDILQGDEKITCSFEVKDSHNQIAATPSFEFTAGETQEQTIISGLLPDQYTVVEGSCGGLVPDGGTTQNINLNLPTCRDTVIFNNIVGEGSAVAEVNKVTMPAGLENDWVMTLNGPGTNGGIQLITSDTNPGSFERFVIPGADFHLLEGSYTITEQAEAGWVNTASSGCEFTINYPEDFGAVKQCTFTNKKLGRILITKVTEPAGGTGFGFTQNIDGTGTGAFNLNDNETETFENVPDGNYTVTEDNPGLAYELVGLVCTDDIEGNGWNVNDSSIDIVNRKAAISLDPGETVHCTFTNRKKGKIIIQKIVKGTDMSTSFNFETTGAGYVGFPVKGGEQNEQYLNAGIYTARELVPLGWVLTGIGGSTTDPYNCKVEGSGGSTGIGDLNTQTATIDLKNGDIVTCIFENTGAGVTRTQGFWATHPQLAQIAWDGGTGFGHTFPGVSNKSICGQSLTIKEVMGGFWSSIAKTSTGAKRTAVEQARMQLLQQLLAAELNASAFGSVPSKGSIADWQNFLCGTDQKKINTAQQQAATFNTQGDSGTFTPGTSADSKTARSLANIPFWNKVVK